MQEIRHFPNCQTEADLKKRYHRQNHSTSIFQAKLCRYCSQKYINRHICPRRYIYEFIFEPFIKRVFLDTQPFCYLDLYQNCRSIISQERLFAECGNIDSVLYEYLVYYIEDYEFAI